MRDGSQGHGRGDIRAYVDALSRTAGCAGSNISVAAVASRLAMLEAPAEFVAAAQAPGRSDQGRPVGRNAQARANDDTAKGASS